MKLRNLFISISIASSLLITGCTTQVDNYFNFDQKQFSPLKEKHSAKTVFIQSITDNRTFAEAESTIHPEQQTISSYTPDKALTKAKIVARNQTISPCTAEESVANCTANAKSYSALGENLCFRDQAAKEYVKLAIEKGFEDAGYKVLSYNTDVTETSVILDLTLDRFWYWLDYKDVDRVAYTEVIVSFKAFNKATKKTSNFKISNISSMNVLNFMSPLKGSIESSLVEYSHVVQNNINKQIN